MPTIKTLYIACLVGNQSDAGTEAKNVLTICDNGTDVLHLVDIFWPKDFKLRRNVGKFSWVDVSRNNIRTQNLNNSSIRVGLLGEDSLRLQHYVIWGEAQSILNITRVIPIAIETDINLILSTALSTNIQRPDEINSMTTRSSIPIRLVNGGSDLTRINRLLVVVKTNFGDKDAGTDSPVELQITGRNGNLLIDFDLPDTTQADLEKGKTNIYTAPVSVPFSKRDLTTDSIRLNIKGADAWRPDAFFLFGLDDASGHPESMIPLVHIPHWNLGILSTDSEEGESSVILPLYLEASIDEPPVKS